MLRTLKSSLPPSVRAELGKLRRRLRVVALAGDTVTCPVCGRHFRRFLTARGPLVLRNVEPRTEISPRFRFVIGRKELVRHSRRNAVCPSCDAEERHRRAVLLVRRLTNVHQPIRLLHVAAEPALRREIEALPGVDYLPVDRYGSDVRATVDLTAMGFRAASFDAAICSHVLEHVADDAKAMAELRRVLKPGGWALIDVPMITMRESTFEDWSITRPKDRRRVFGHEDHVRVYGRNFPELLRAAGFEVLTDPLELDADEERRYALRGDAMQDFTCLCRPAPAAPSSAAALGALR